MQYGGVLLHFCWQTKNADRFVSSAHPNFWSPFLVRPLKNKVPLPIRLLQQIENQLVHRSMSCSGSGILGPHLRKEPLSVFSRSTKAPSETGWSHLLWWVLFPGISPEHMSLKVLRSLQGNTHDLCRS